jgi:hypothetical protein
LGWSCKSDVTSRTSANTLHANRGGIIGECAQYMINCSICISHSLTSDRGVAISPNLPRNSSRVRQNARLAGRLCRCVAGARARAIRNAHVATQVGSNYFNCADIYLFARQSDTV